MPVSTRHLRPTGALSPRALLCGDPGRCLTLATALLDRPLMFNHARGLWGYTGTAADGQPLTIQATGLGAASAAIVTDELCQLGLRTLVRIGTARDLTRAGRLGPGTLVAVTGALAADGPSRALGARGTVAPDEELTASLCTPRTVPALVASADLVHPAAAELAVWVDAGALVCDLQTAAVLQVAHRHGARAAALLVVTGSVAPDPAAVPDDGAEARAVAAAARIATVALGIPPRETLPLPPPQGDEPTAVP